MPARERLQNSEELKSKEKEPPRHLSMTIMGVTAGGKTTAGKSISKELGFIFVEEDVVEENPFFENYYKDPDKWALPMQLYCLFMKQRQIKGGGGGAVSMAKLLERNAVISEPPAYEDGLYAQARLEESPQKWKWKLYKDFYEGIVLHKDFPKPDLLYYLRLSFPSMLRRIRKRALEDPLREPELQEKEEYWKRLWDLHEDWVKRNPLGLKIISINGDRFDFSRYPNSEEAKSDLLTEFLNQTRYHLIDLKTDERKIDESIIIPEVIVNHRPRPNYIDKLPSRGLISGVPRTDR